MKTKLFLFALITLLCVACEKNKISTQQYEGVWVNVVNYGYKEVIITSDSIIGCDSTRNTYDRNHYTMLAENRILLERCWLIHKNGVDYYCETYIRAWEDSLVIGDFCGTLHQVYPPEYKEIKLVRK